MEAPGGHECGKTGEVWGAPCPVESRSKAPVRTKSPESEALTALLSQLTQFPVQNI